MSDSRLTQFLDWLPPRFPATVRCIVSSRDDHRPCLARLEERQVHLCRLTELTDDDVARVTEHYLSAYSKVQCR